MLIAIKDKPQISNSWLGSFQCHNSGIHAPLVLYVHLFLSPHLADRWKKTLRERHAHVLTTLTQERHTLPTHVPLIGLGQMSTANCKSRWDM